MWKIVREEYNMGKVRYHIIDSKGNSNVIAKDVALEWYKSGFLVGCYVYELNGKEFLAVDENRDTVASNLKKSPRCQLEAKDYLKHLSSLKDSLNNSRNIEDALVTMANEAVKANKPDVTYTLLAQTEKGYEVFENLEFTEFHQQLKDVTSNWLVLPVRVYWGNNPLKHSSFITILSGLHSYESRI